MLQEYVSRDFIGGNLERHADKLILNYIVSNIRAEMSKVKTTFKTKDNTNEIGKIW